MKKIIIRKRHLDCVIKQRENQKLSSLLPKDLDGKLRRSIELREEFSDIIPFAPDDRKNCEDYLDALELENYEICDNFFLVR